MVHYPHYAKAMALTGDYDLVCNGHEHRAVIGTLAEELEELLHLLAPLRRTQSEVRRDDADRLAVAVEVGGDGAAGLALPVTEIEQAEGPFDDVILLGPRSAHVVSRAADALAFRPR